MIDTKMDCQNCAHWVRKDKYCRVNDSMCPGFPDKPCEYFSNKADKDTEIKLLRAENARLRAALAKARDCEYAVNVGCDCHGQKRVCEFEKR